MRVNPNGGSFNPTLDILAFSLKTIVKTMATISASYNPALRFLILLLAGLSTSALGGCGRSKKHSHHPGRTRQATRPASTGRDPSVVLLKSITATLEDLPREVDLVLQPPQVILDASKSSDQKEVQAICSVNPEVLEGPYNFLQVASGNASFRRLGVRAGDIVRYYVNFDKESQEHGIAKRTYLQLIVRRLDTRNPENALVVEGGLTGPVAVPERLEIWRYSDRRMNEIRKRLNRYVKLRRPVVGWEPTPDEKALLQLVERINLWLRSRPDQNTRLPWQADPLRATLPAPLREAKEVAVPLQANALRDGLFSDAEGRLLQQAIWLRDISTWAINPALSDVEVASALFDWTVRNIQLDQPEEEPIVFHPWQALMYGHGTAAQRAWVFAELCRQQQLDVVMLSVVPLHGAGTSDAGTSGNRTRKEGGAGDKNSLGEPHWWLPALWSEGQLSLFDTQLGLPIPGPQDNSVATLTEVLEQPALLNRLKLDDAHPYRVDARGLARIEACLVASPLQLSRRALLLQSHLEGERSVVLSADNGRLAEALKKHAHLAGVKLWAEPYRAIRAEHSIKPAARQRAAFRVAVFAQRPKLWKARVLHFQGFKPVPPELRDDPLAEPNRGHRDALRLYQDRTVRPSEQQLNALQPAKQAIYRTAKYDASYWLGLLCYDMRKYASATNWLKARTLEAVPPSPWASGARYNLARTYEAENQWEKAIELLRTGGSPQHHGNRLRARQLQEKLEEGSAVGDRQ